MSFEDKYNILDDYTNTIICYKYNQETDEYYVKAQRTEYSNAFYAIIRNQKLIFVDDNSFYDCDLEEFVVHSCSEDYMKAYLDARKAGY